MPSHGSTDVAVAVYDPAYQFFMPAAENTGVAVMANMIGPAYVSRDSGKLI